MEMEMMNVKMVEIVENGGMGVVLYNVSYREVNGKGFKKVVDNVFKDLMEDYKNEEIEKDFYYVESVKDSVGCIRLGEDKMVYVIEEGSEWFNLDCEDGEFFEFCCSLEE